MRFTLNDEKDRSFRVQRWCFRGSIDAGSTYGSQAVREAGSGQEILPAHRTGVVLRVDVIDARQPRPHQTALGFLS